MVLALLLSVPVQASFSPGESELERVIIRTNGQFDTLALAKLGISVIEDYEGFVLGSISQETAQFLAESGVETFAYPDCDYSVSAKAWDGVQWSNVWSVWITIESQGGCWPIC